MKEIVLKESKGIGKTIKDLRAEMKITQEELAYFTRLSCIGVVKLEKEENDFAETHKLFGMVGTDEQQTHHY